MDTLAITKLGNKDFLVWKTPESAQVFTAFTEDLCPEDGSWVGKKVQLIRRPGEEGLVLTHEDRVAKVLWANGSTCSYPVGREGKAELALLEDAPLTVEAP